MGVRLREISPAPFFIDKIIKRGIVDNRYLVDNLAVIHIKFKKSE